MSDAHDSPADSSRIKVYGTEGFRFEDSEVRHLTEADIPGLVRLFRACYADSYPYPQLFDPEWIKRGIYNDHLIWLAIEEGGELVASGAVSLESGDHNDQIGEIGRVVVHPASRGRHLGRRIIDALLDAADDIVEYAFGEARTSHPFSQGLLDRSGFAAVGMSPQRLILDDSRESLIMYANLYGNAPELRRRARPRLVPEVEALAVHALSALALSADVEIQHCEPYAASICPPRQEPLCLASRVHLIRLGESSEPLVFGPVSMDWGFSQLRRKRAEYTVIFDDLGQPVGAVGYRMDPVNRILRGIDLIGNDDRVRCDLCRLLVRHGDLRGAAIVELEVSAYEPRLQRTLVDLGFVPVAYQPAMVFHGRERVDGIRMLKLNVPYAPGTLSLTEPARAVFDIVNASFERLLVPRFSSPGQNR